MSNLNWLWDNVYEIGVLVNWIVRLMYGINLCGYLTFNELLNEDKTPEILIPLRDT